MSLRDLIFGSKSRSQPMEAKTLEAKTYPVTQSEAELVCRGEGAELGDVAHAPFRILAAQALVERGVARRVVLAVALERAVEEQPAIGGKVSCRAGEQPFRHRPRRDVDDVGAEY